MRSATFTSRIPQPLRDRMEARARSLGYPSASAYLVGLIRYDMLTLKRHSMTQEVSKLSNAEQDRLDDEIAGIVDSGEGLNGSWFEARIQAAVQEIAFEPTGELPVASKILKMVGRKASF